MRDADDDRRDKSKDDAPVLDSAPASRDHDADSVSLAGVDPEDALRALLRTPPAIKPTDK